MNTIFQNFTFKIGSHRVKNIIWIIFEYSADNMRTLSLFCKPHYSVTAKCWYTFNTKAARDFFGLDEDYTHAIQRINPINRNAFDLYLNQLKLKAYSPNTINNYRTEFTHFLNFIQDQPAENFTPDQLQAYFLYCVNHHKLSEAAINGRINAVKFYYEKVLKNERMFF